MKYIIEAKTNISKYKYPIMLILMIIVFWKSKNKIINLNIPDSARDELIRDVLLWTPTHGRAKAGRPARTYIQQLCEDTGCCPEDLPRAMNDREEWRERVGDMMMNDDDDITDVLVLI